MNIWDEAKRLKNILKHGVDFKELDVIVWDDAYIFEDKRRNYGEQRFVAMVHLQNRLYMVIFVQREGRRRIISVRKANDREVQFYEQKAKALPSNS